MMGGSCCSPADRDFLSRCATPRRARRDPVFDAVMTLAPWRRRAPAAPRHPPARLTTLENTVGVGMSFGLGGRADLMSRTTPTSPTRGRTPGTFNQQRLTIMRRGWPA